MSIKCRFPNRGGRTKSARFLENRSLHLVSAPGSGKTVLGLEVLRRIGSPALVFVEDVSVVALTATPPIDVPAAEWSRYASFCGAVDLEVGVPELVAAGNLCPHQDFVLFSVPTGDDVAELQRFYQGVAQLVLDLQINIEFAENLGIKSPIIWIEKSDDAEFLKRHQTFFLALSIFLQQTGGYIPQKIREVFLLDGNELPPELSIEWAEVLLQGLLFDFRERIETTPEIDPALLKNLSELENAFHDLGAIEKRQVVLRGNEENEKLLRDSTSKLESISQIIDHELYTRGVLMRAVILTDYIRKEAFPTPGEIDPPLAKLGVVPIFEMLRRIKTKFLLPGALTGSIVIVPAETKETLAAIAVRNGIDPDNLKMNPLAYDPNFLQIEVRDADRQRVVAAVTELFQKGEINCLIGTAALLGEGWDAPAINTLILASVIGSFVMSNQMRGRAIRSDPNIPDKTANIWHVATVPPEFQTLDKKVDYEPGNDFAKLLRRFDAFHGVGFAINENHEAIVENGWQRLGLGKSITPHQLPIHNQNMFREASQRENISYVWKRAIAPASDGRFLCPVRELRTPRRIAASQFMLKLGGKENKGIRHNMAGWMARRRLQKIAIAIGLTLHENGLIESEFFPRNIRVEVTPTRLQVSTP